MRSASHISDQLRSEGFAFLKAYKLLLSTNDMFQTIGTIEAVEGLKSIHTLTPTPIHEAPPNTYSGNFGTSEFPLHTDLAHWSMPPRYLGLRCIVGTSAVPTRVYDGNGLILHFGLSELRMLLVHPRRPMMGEKQLLPILQRCDAGMDMRLRWDGIYLRPAMASATNLFSEIKSFVTAAKPQDVVLSEPGDVLIIDNWRILHGRAPTPPESSSRRIERAYLSSIYGQS